MTDDEEEEEEEATDAAFHPYRSARNEGGTDRRFAIVGLKTFNQAARTINALLLCRDGTAICRGASRERASGKRREKGCIRAAILPGRVLLSRNGYRADDYRAAH